MVRRIGYAAAFVAAALSLIATASAASAAVTINSGGGLLGTGLKTTYAQGQMMAWRYGPSTPGGAAQANVAQFYNGTAPPGGSIYNQVVLGVGSGAGASATGTVFVPPALVAQNTAPAGVTKVGWTAVDTSISGTEFTSTLTGVRSGRTYVVTVRGTALGARNLVNLSYSVKVPDGHPATESVRLYHLMDSFLDGSDDASGLYQEATACTGQIVYATRPGAVMEGLQYAGGHPWSGYASVFYNNVVFGTFGGGATKWGANYMTDLPNLTDPNGWNASPATDNGFGVSWNLGSTPGTYEATNRLIIDTVLPTDCTTPPPAITIPSAAVAAGSTVTAVNAVSSSGSVAMKVTIGGRVACESTAIAGAAGDVASSCVLDAATQELIRSGAVTLVVESTITDGAGRTATATRSVTTPFISIPQAVVVSGASLSAVNAVTTAGSVRMRVTLEGAAVCEATGTAEAAGDLALSCPLDDAARRAVAAGTARLLITSTVTDATGQTSTATRTVTAADISPLPIALPVIESVPVGSATTIPLLGSVSAVGPVAINPASLALRDPATGTYGATVTIAGKGTFQANADGSVTFTPAAGYTGPVPVISYRFTDAAGRSAASTLALTVRGAASPPPWADPVVGLTTPGTPVLLNPFTGPGSDLARLDLRSVRVRNPITDAWVTGFTMPGEGRYAVDPATGKITFTPAKGFTGWATPVAYRASTTTGRVIQSAVRVRVAPHGPALRTTLRVTKKTLPVGSRTTVRLRVQDTGRLNATDVVSRVSIPRGFRVVTTGGGTLRGSDVIFRLGTIGVGRSAVRSIVLVASASAAGTRSSVGAKATATGVAWSAAAPVPLAVLAVDPTPAVAG